MHQERQWNLNLMATTLLMSRLVELKNTQTTKTFANINFTPSKAWLRLFPLFRSHQQLGLCHTWSTAKIRTTPCWRSCCTCSTRGSVAWISTRRTAMHCLIPSSVCVCVVTFCAFSIVCEIDCRMPFFGNKWRQFGTATRAVAVRAKLTCWGNWWEAMYCHPFWSGQWPTQDRCVDPHRGKICELKCSKFVAQPWIALHHHCMNEHLTDSTWPQAKVYFFRFRCGLAIFSACPEFVHCTRTISVFQHQWEKEGDIEHHVKSTQQTQHPNHKIYHHVSQLQTQTHFQKISKTSISLYTPSKAWLSPMRLFPLFRSHLQSGLDPMSSTTRTRTTLCWRSWCTCSTSSCVAWISTRRTAMHGLIPRWVCVCVCFDILCI